MNIHGIVKGNSLSCYNWEHEDKITILNKLDELDPGIYLIEVYNHDKHCYGAVASDQIVIYKNTLDQLEPLLKGSNMILGYGNSEGIINIGFS